MNRRYLVKQVEFVRIKAEVTGYGFIKGISNTFDGAEDIIRERLLDGWDFHGYVPVSTRGTGEIEEMSLVFTKED